MKDCKTNDTRIKKEHALKRGINQRFFAGLKAWKTIF